MEGAYEEKRTYQAVWKQAFPAAQYSTHRMLQLTRAKKVKEYTETMYLAMFQRLTMGVSKVSGI